KTCAVVLCPSGALSWKGIELDDVPPPERRHGLVGRPTLHANDDRTIGERIVDLTNRGERDGGPYAEPAWLDVVAAAANDCSATPVVPAVQNAAQVFSLLEKRIGLIDEEGGLVLFDGPVERSRRDIRRRQRSSHEATKDFQDRRLSAPLLGRQN